MGRWAIALFAISLVVGCDDDEPGDATPASGAEPARQERAGEALYRRYCALCHGRDGEGYAADDAPALANQEWLRTASDEFITAAIADGRPGTAMSAWSRSRGGPLRDPQIEAILRYLRSWQRHPRASVEEIVVEGDAGHGRGLFAVHCARCHGARGEGVDAVSLANPAFLATASDGFLQYAIAHGRSGTRMPAFSETLAPPEINDLVAYVRSLEQGAPGLAPPPEETPELPSLDSLPLVVNPEGPPARLTLREERFVAAADVRAQLDRGARMVILDARATSDWLRGRIPGAIPVPFYDLDAIIEGLPRDGTWMIAYCGCPHAASGRVVDSLRSQGFTNTAVLDEGIHHWESQEYPLASGPEPP